MSHVVLITTQSAPTRCLANAIRAQGLHLAGILEERRRVTPTDSGALKRIARSVSPQFVWDWLSRVKRLIQAPKWEREVWHREAELARRARRMLLTEAARFYSEEWPAAVPVCVVPDINGPEANAFLTERAPDVIALYECSIARREILELPKVAALNAHPALLPEYRGSLVEFWQVHNDDYAHAGITVHHAVDSVDAGDIVHQAPVRVTDRPDPFLLGVRNQLQIVTDYPKAIAAVLDGSAERRPQPSGGRVYRKADLTPEIRRAILQNDHDGAALAAGVDD